jgi:vacuolar-type H+-ATPase subunit H
VQKYGYYAKSYAIKLLKPAQPLQGQNNYKQKVVNMSTNNLFSQITIKIIAMSKAAKPLKTKEEKLFDKAKDVIGDLWNITTDTAEEVKENATKKIEDIKEKITSKKATPVKKGSTANAKVSHKTLKPKLTSLTKTAQTATKRVIAKKASVSASTAENKAAAASK